MCKSSVFQKHSESISIHLFVLSLSVLITCVRSIRSWLVLFRIQCNPNACKQVEVAKKITKLQLDHFSTEKGFRGIYFSKFICSITLLLLLDELKCSVHLIKCLSQVKGRNLQHLNDSILSEEANIGRKKDSSTVSFSHGYIL